MQHEAVFVFSVEAKRVWVQIKPSLLKTWVRLIRFYPPLGLSVNLSPMCVWVWHLIKLISYSSFSFIQLLLFITGGFIHCILQKNNIYTSLVTFEPNSQPAPLGLMAQLSTSSGSDQTRSQNAPLCGISWLRSMVRIWSSVLMSGESPPWTQSTCSSINCKKLKNHFFNLKNECQKNLDFRRCLNASQLTAATVNMSNTLVQYRQAFALPYLVWHSSAREQSAQGA